MANEPNAVTINIKTAGHEELDGLIGGDADGHYHLTEEEYNLMLEVLDNRREEDVSEEVYYKLSETEYDKVTTLLAMFFPDDDTAPEEALAALIVKHIKTLDSGEVIGG